MTAEEVFTELAGVAESVKSNAEHALPFMDVGDEVRQGDIYVTRIAAVPDGAVRVESPPAQLAPGTTQGSRHCLRSLAGVKAYRLAEPGPLDGPVLEASKPLAVDHPEHGNRVLPAGVYAVTYQRAFAEEIRRVAD